MDIDSFIVCIKTENIYVDIAKDVETRFDTSNYKVERPLPRAKLKKYWINERWIRWENYESLSYALRPKTYSNLIDDNDENKSVKGSKECIIKGKLKFEDQDSDKPGKTWKYGPFFLQTHGNSGNFEYFLKIRKFRENSGKFFQPPFLWFSNRLLNKLSVNIIMYQARH